jgi:hypothetical protein
MRSATCCLLVVVALSTACRRPATIAPAPTPSAEEYCWWAVVTSPLRADSVAQRFARAFTAYGLADLRIDAIGDTIVVEAGPTRTPAVDPGQVATRLVVVPSEDGSRFRHFVTLTPDLERRTLDICAALAASVRVGAVAPREQTGDEALPVWMRRAARPPR